jgi:hypothetical protein
LTGGRHHGIAPASGGNPQWARFFALMGSVHAIYEKSPTVPGTPVTHENLYGEVNELERELGAIRALTGFAKLTEHITGKRGERREWYLIEMYPQQGRMTIRGFPQAKFDVAKAELAGAEQRFADTPNQAVLVSVSSLNELRKAYPNYFGDTEHFCGGDVNDFNRQRRMALGWGARRSE